MPSALRLLQLRSSSAHCVRKLAKSLRRVGKAEVDMEVDAKVVEEKLEEREEEEEVEDEEEETEEENNCDKI